MPFDIRVDAFPARQTLDRLWRASWNAPADERCEAALQRSLCHVCAYDADELIGFVPVAWDGAQHAFLLDPTVHPQYRRKGLGTTLVSRAIEIARQRGANWLHVDFEPNLQAFYRGLGFRPTEAGLIDLTKTR